MVIEVLHPGNEWWIDLPREDVYIGRILEAREGSFLRMRWKFTGDTPIRFRTNGRWSHLQQTRDGRAEWIEGWSFGQIVAECLEKGYQLFSLPASSGEADV